MIAGTAGVGKTALAVHWAHRLAARFADGQLYLDLRGHARGPPMRPVDALAQLLRAAGVAAARVPAELAEAASMYRSLLADRRVLVMLDNAASPDQVRPLLPGSPTLSYQQLAAQERRLFRLLGLAAGDDVSAAAAATLAGITPEQAERLLDRLAAAHLLEQRAPGRFVFHDLLRLYAADRLLTDASAAGSPRS